MSKDKTSNNALRFLCFFVAFVLVFEWVLTHDIHQLRTLLFEKMPWLQGVMDDFYGVVVDYLFFIKLLLLAGIIVGELAKDNAKIKLKQYHAKGRHPRLMILLFLVFLCSAFFLFPLNVAIAWRYVYPASLLGGLLLLPLLIFDLKIYAFSKSSLSLPTGMKGKDRADNLVWRVARGKWNKRQVIVNNPYQGIYIEGGAGAGKSLSVVVPLIDQVAKKGYAGFLYDYKGAPPTLSKALYTSLLRYRASVNFAHLNFSMLELSGRCNPLSPHYITSKIHAEAYATAILKNLNKSWIGKQDFWCLNSIAYLGGIIWFLKRRYPSYCSLPHATLLGLKSIHAVTALLSQDPEVSAMIAPILSACQEKAKDQLAGIAASFQLPLVKLYNKNIFWVLNGSGSSMDIDLDLTHPQAPRFLSVANDPSMSEALSPVIALLASVCIKNMNQQGKHKGMFILDEAPSLHIPDLMNLPATARSNHVATVVCVQDFAQLTSHYGTNGSHVLRANLGNQFFGMSNNLDTACYVSRLVGDVDKMALSVSTSDSTESRSLSLKKDRIMASPRVMNQKAGEFVVRLTNGDPPVLGTSLKAHSQEDLSLPELVKDRDSLQRQVDANFSCIHKDVAAIFQDAHVGLDTREDVGISASAVRYRARVDF